MTPKHVWKTQSATENQLKCMRGILNMDPSLTEQYYEVTTKWDAYHFIAKHIHVLDKKRKPAPTEQREQEIVKEINMCHYCDEGEARYYAPDDVAEPSCCSGCFPSRPWGEKKPKPPLCKYCNQGNEAQFYDLVTNGQLTMCHDCYKDSLNKPSPQQLKEIAHIEEHVNFKFKGTSRADANLFIAEHGFIVAMVKSKDISASTCVKCSKKAVFFGTFQAEREGLYRGHDALHYCSDHYDNDCEQTNRELVISHLHSLNNLSTTPTIQEETNMFKGLSKVFGEFGQDTTGRFATSFQGTAVKVNGTYVTFDGQDTTDVMELIIPGGDKFLFKMPATLDQIDTGDVILNGDRVLFVKDVQNDGNILAIDPLTNDIVTHAPRKNVFGIQFFTRVISLMNFSQEGSINPMMLMMMSATEKDSRDSYRPHAPSNKFEELMPMIMMMSMQNQQGSNNPMQQMLPMMMLGGGNTEKMLPLMMMSQSFTGGNQANPFASLFPQKPKKARPAKSVAKETTAKKAAAPRKPKTTAKKASVTVETTEA